MTAVDWLLDQGLAADASAMAGDSAGGGLTLATLLARREPGVAVPGAAALSVAVDRPHHEHPVDGRQRRHRPDARPAPTASSYADWYLGPDGDPTTPTASPRFGDLSGLPPVLLHTGRRRGAARRRPAWSPRPSQAAGGEGRSGPGRASSTSGTRWPAWPPKPTRRSRPPAPSCAGTSSEIAPTARTPGSRCDPRTRTSC